MTYFQTFRQFLFDFRKSLFSRRRKRAYQPYQPGIPKGLEQALLYRVSQEQLGAEIQTVSYQHLSGWKASGAYRLQIQSKQGKNRWLIFKEAVYNFEEIPALADLPVCPGPPEYAVFSQSTGDLAQFLPEIYFAEEVIPGKHYRYIVEDLAHDYNNAAASAASLEISRRLPALHQALIRWAGEADTGGFIQYGPGFTRLLQQYAQKHLEAYRSSTGDPLVERALVQWDDITSLHLHPVFANQPPSSPIHGDTNFTNIYIHKRDPNRIKVVDWEWAGFGSPLADLVSLLKGAGQRMERKAFDIFLKSASTLHPRLIPDLSEAQLYQYYLWSQLERGMLDASFLAAQRLYSEHGSHINLNQAITGSLRRMLAAYQQLSNE